MPHGDAEQLGSNGGWTTGCCTVQFIYKEVPGGNPREIQLKFFVRAWSQFCKSCNKVGDIGTYPDEIDRLSSAYAEYLMKVFFRHVRPNAKSRPKDHRQCSVHISRHCARPARAAAASTWQEAMRGRSTRMVEGAMIDMAKGERGRVAQIPQDHPRTHRASDATFSNQLNDTSL